ncbi:MAG TPA: DUF3482 domain-containing protein [Casimicrobiaceae bacterium]|nr:DUF3482 domain-containing protein [Casimicrobiaceae bacterium]
MADGPRADDAIPGATIALSLISHTNAGKTTLARTLVGRDVGAVSDAQHVTQEAAVYTLLETAGGEALLLWDTPGFGDSARLARRLAQQHHPLGWFLSEVWDRFRDRAFHLAQQAVRNVAADADVVLYLVNATELPGDAGYLVPELDILEWIGKPVVVLVNQTGAPRPRDAEAAQEDAWRHAIGARPMVRAVATLDAFTRCWVQEIALLDLVGDALPESRRALNARLAQAWQARRVVQFDTAMAILAAPIAAAACDREALAEGGAIDAWRDIGRRLGIAADAASGRAAGASRALASRLADALRGATDRLVALHELDGRAQREVEARIAEGVSVDAPMSEGKAALMGGAVSGALTGLAADIATGGLSFGAGMLAGAILGALGGAGVARGMNLARGKTGAVLRFDDAFLTGLVASALLRYLTVAHYGRGRGEWSESEHPAFWTPLVTEIIEYHRDRLARIWSMRVPACEEAALRDELQSLLRDAAWQTLDRLYPGTLPSR